jgi:hypothetical protein
VDESFPLAQVSETQTDNGHVTRKMRSGSLTDLVRMAERLGDV